MICGPKQLSTERNFENILIFFGHDYKLRQLDYFFLQSYETKTLFFYLSELRE